MKFAEVSIQMVDYPSEPVFDTVLLLETLNSETANLGYEQSQLLYQKVSLDYANEKSKYKRFLKVKNDPILTLYRLNIPTPLHATSHKVANGKCFCRATLSSWWP